MRAPTCDVSVLIVTYNSCAFVDDCIDAVAETVRRHSYEVIVVDNASNDDTASYLRGTRPELTVVDMGRNAGFSAANNRAMEIAGGRHLLLLNGDAVVEENAIDELITFLDSTSHAGAVAPKLLNPDGTDQATARTFPTPGAAIWGRRSPLTRLFPNNAYARRYLAGRDRSGCEPFEIDWVSGACLMVPRAVVERVGGLDDRFFMYWEDADWCHRIKDAGYHVWCVPSARAVHAEGGSRRGWPARQLGHFHRSAYRYYAKHELRGRRSVLRPVAAAALSARAALVITRDVAARSVRPKRTSDAGHGVPGPLKAGELQ